MQVSGVPSGRAREVGFFRRRGRVAAAGVGLLLAATVALATGSFAAPGGSTAALDSQRAAYAGYHFYFGNLHAHTGYSDGLKLPADAFRKARDVAGMDFMAVTDHDYMMLEVPAHWEELKKTAARFTDDGRFVALAGAEWTENTSGHMNLFSYGAMITRDTHPNPESLYRWLDGGPAYLAQFNHPDPEFQRNWNDFAYDWNANRTIRLLEVGNGYWTHNLRYEASYVKALDRGWYVGAVSNQDNHSANWGTEGDSRTGVLAPSLTKENLVAALRAERTYATEDRNVEVYFAAGRARGDGVRGVGDEGQNVILGGHLDNDRQPVRLFWRVADPDPGDVVNQVDVIGNGGRVVGRWSVGDDGAQAAGMTAGAVEGALDVTPQSGYSWYYLHIYQKDGDQVVTAPIWVEHPSRLALADLTVVGPAAKVDREAVLGATLVNHSDRSFSGVSVVLSVDDGGQPVSQAEIARVTVDIPAGGVAPIKLEWVPKAEGSQELSVVVSEGGSDSAPGSAANRYSLEVIVQPSDLPRVLIDEGHNNRFTGLSGRFRALLSGFGWEGAIGERAFTGPELTGYRAVVIATPEDGISLLPNTFADEEIGALAPYVSGGGALVLAGGGPELASEGASFAELNRVLEAVGSSLRLDDIGTVISVGKGLALDFGAGGEPNTRPLAAGQAVPVAYEKVGAAGGLVVVLNEPIYSDYDMQGEAGEKNVAFLQSLFAWLAERKQ